MYIYVYIYIYIYTYIRHSSAAFSRRGLGQCCLPCNAPAVNTSWVNMQRLYDNHCIIIHHILLPYIILSHIML